MPKYKLSAFEYECALLRARITEQEVQLEELELFKDSYSPKLYDSLNSQKATHLSIIESYNEKLIPLEDKLNEYRAAYTPNDKYFDYAPLEYLYQDFLNNHLNAILNKIETAHTNIVNQILSSFTFITIRKAHQIASRLMYSSIIGYTVEKYITHEQINELRSLPRNIKDSIYAIDEKYRYFMDRIQCCPEIGKKIIELERY